MSAKGERERVDILIVEDSATQAEELSFILEQQGYRLYAARNGERALAMIRRQAPTLVISDVVMPEMDGYSLCRRLKDDAELRRIPVILLTSLSDPVDVMRGLECGADSFILKPYDERHLLARITYVLANRRLREEEGSRMGVEIFFAGRKFFITSDRLQILNLLLSTYEAAVQKNRELAAARDELRQLNEHLEMKVAERTAALEAENRQRRNTEQALRESLSERNRSAEAVRASQQLLEAVIDNSSAVIYVKDLEGRFLLINRRFEELFHVSRARMIGRTDHDLFEKHIADAFRDFDKRVLAAGTALESEEVAPHDDGPHTYISIKCPLNDATGTPYAVCGISTDITERKLAQARQQAQLARLSLLHRIVRATGERQNLQSVFQAVIGSLLDNLAIDLGCVCLYDAAETTLKVMSVGARKQELVHAAQLAEQMKVAIDGDIIALCARGRLVYEPDVRSVSAALTRRFAGAGLMSLVIAPLIVESLLFGVLIAARETAHGFSSSDCEFFAQLSEHVALAAHQTQLYEALRRAYDDLRQTQQAVMQQERLRALGQMASGVAHDINNAISPAALYAQSLLEHEPGLSAQARNYLETIQRAVEDVAQTVARMREFYRPRDPRADFTRVDLNALALQVVDLTRARWRDLPQRSGIVIQLRTELALQLPVVTASEGEIRDALTNLVFNAVDAMPSGGTLTLRTRAAGDSGGVILEVADTGMGMDETTKRRCLEPFFTTKGERGTGLGLAMVYGTVQRHGAQIDIESEPGAGTVMRLVFPVTLPVSRPAQVVPEVTQLPLPALHLLLVDDDPLITRSLREVLEGDGHRVAIADGGQAGIDAFTAAHAGTEPFSAVITDLGMPYVDGSNVAMAVKAISPRTPVILLTGWGHRLTAENEIPPHVDRVLSKPPKLRELRSALVEVAARRAG